MIAAAESFLNWLDIHMIGNPQPATELAKAINVKIFDKLPYDINNYRLFSFDDAIRISYYFNEGDDPEVHRQLVFSRENIQLIIRFEKLFTEADQQTVISLLDTQFKSTAATDTPKSVWLDNVEIIIAHHHLLKRPEYAKHDAVKLWFKEKRETLKTLKMSEVFISYSWDSAAHEQQVVNFTNHLRKEGFNATIDKMLIQQKTATNFVRMMHEAFKQHPKIIVLLSEGYKQKAESFSGGVGEEYELLINDIKKNEHKYILASLQGRSDDIVPMGLAGRDIIDLSKPEERTHLYAKLMDQPLYEFAPVGAKKPTIQPEKPQAFTPPTVPVPIQILPPRFTPTGNSGSMGGLYNRVELQIDIEFKNSSAKTVTEFAGQVHLSRYFVMEQGPGKQKGEMAELDFQVERKVFPGQTTIGLQIIFELNRGNIYRVFNSLITITVFTEQGNAQASFNFNDLLKLKTPGEQWSEVKPIDISMFQH